MKKNSPRNKNAKAKEPPNIIDENALPAIIFVHGSFAGAGADINANLSYKEELAAYH